MIIDAHMHFWHYDPVKDAWITPAMASLKRDFLPAEAWGLMGAEGVGACIAVQADSSMEETLFLLNLAERYDFILAVVGWMDVRNARFEEELERMADDQKLKGLRHILQAEPDGFMLSPEFTRGMGCLQKYGLCYDLLVYPQQLAESQQLVATFPQQKFVLDHGAKPLIKQRHIDEWKKQIKILAQYPNLACKLSGLVTEADWLTWSPADIRPYLEVLLEAFGPDRLMYGSDWPVCTLAAAYGTTIDLIKDFISSLSLSEQKNIMGENAAQWYQIN